MTACSPQKQQPKGKTPTEMLRYEMQKLGLGDYELRKQQEDGEVSEELLGLMKDAQEGTLSRLLSIDKLLPGSIRRHRHDLQDRLIRDTMAELHSANWPYYVKDPNGTKSSIQPLNDIDCIRIYQSVAELKQRESSNPLSLKMYLPFSKVKINLATMSAYSDDKPESRLVLVHGKYNERHRARDSMKTADASAFVLKPVPITNG